MSPAKTTSKKVSSTSLASRVDMWWGTFVGRRAKGTGKGSAGEAKVAGEAKAIDSYGAPGSGKSGLISIFTIASILSSWWISTSYGWVPPLFLPPPEIVWSKFLRISCVPTYLQEFQNYLGLSNLTPDKCVGFNDSTLLQHSFASLQRVFTAFGFAVIVGVPIGISMGMSRVSRGVFDPPIEFYRPIPPLAYLPLTIIWFGIGDVSKIILIFLACFAPLALNARAGVRSVSIEQIHAAYSMGATSRQVVWHVVLKGALPEILTGMRVAIAFGWTTLVAAEMVAAKAGLGVMVLNAARYLATDIVFLGIIVIGLIAYCFDLVMRWVERTLVPWKGKV